MDDSRYPEIESLLEDERVALVSGDLASLSGIADRKEELLCELADSDLAPGTLAAMRGKAERNAELLTAAAKGVRNVVRRIADIREANGPLKTYGRDGTQQTLGSAGASFEKRA